MRATITESIDWSESAAVFVGIEQFRAATDAWSRVDYAADDAVDMAYLFTNELKKLRADRVAVVLAGQPSKPASQAALQELRRTASVVIDSAETPVDPALIYQRVHAYSEMVGPNGAFIVFMATHGVTARGEHVLLTPDAQHSAVRGVALQKMLQAIPSGHANRLLLFVDACRAELGSAADTRMPAGLLETLDIPGNYAIFTASAPGGYARGDDDLKNGLFTHAVLDTFRSSRDGVITPNTLASHVGARVAELSHSDQRPESRFSGLNDLPLVVRDAGEVATILTPREGADVQPLDYVDVQVFERGLSGTVLVCAGANGVCYNQNSTAAPVSMPADQVKRMTVQFGEPDCFEVYVALSADSEFLRGRRQIASGTRERERANRIVYWYGPINVTLKEES